MTYFGELVINGVAKGFLYALIALGFVVIFKATHVINFAAGSMLLLGAYIVVRLVEDDGADWPFWPALLVGMAISGLFALIIERGLISRNRHADPGTLSILMIGIDIVLATDLVRRIGAYNLSPGDPWGAEVVKIGPFTIAQARIATMVIAGILVGLFFIAYKYSSWGIATRATADDTEAAELMGIRRGRVSAVTWAVAGGLSAVAGVFLGTSPSAGITNLTHLTALNAFPAAVIGGLDSTGGAVAGGMIVGLVESFANGYGDRSALSWIGTDLGSLLPWVVMLLVLLFRPTGLFGTKELTRV